MSVPRDQMTVGELARRVGKTPRALRLYEEMGLLEPRGRSEGGFRLYGPEAVDRLVWIQQMTDLGLPLTEIRSLLEHVKAACNGGAAMDVARARFRERLAEVEDQLRRLRRLRDALRASLDYIEKCQGCPETLIPRCCSRCDRHDGEPPPELVTGMLARPDGLTVHLEPMKDPASGNTPGG